MPVTIAQAKLYCRVSLDIEDDLFTDLIASAANQVENDTGVILNPRTLQKDYSKIGEKVILPYWPINSVASVMIGATDVAASFDIDLTERPAKLVPITSVDLAQGERLSVSYNAGYTGEPAALIEAQLMLIAHRYENREGEFPNGYIDKIRPFQTLRI